MIVKGNSLLSSPLLGTASYVSVYSAGELTPEEVDKVVAVINNPLAYNIPQWFLNRQKDIHTGQYKQIVANNLQAALREDINDLKKMRYVFGFEWITERKSLQSHLCDWIPASAFFLFFKVNLLLIFF